MTTCIGIFGADPTAAFNGVQAVVMAIVALAFFGTAVAYSLGVPAGMTGALFVVLLAVLTAVGWHRIEAVYPRHRRWG